MSELSDEAMYERMAMGWRGGQPFTVCGNGSTLDATANIRRWLPQILDRYDIESLADVGAGDGKWMIDFDWPGVTRFYFPLDLIPRGPQVRKFDVTRELLPYNADAILCRMVLNHLQERIERTVELLKASGSRYLIATQFNTGVNRTQQFQRLDLRPYFGEPLESVQDGNEDECTLALWKI